MRSNLSFENGYKPSEDEDFMNPAQTAYFRLKLTNWKAELVENLRSTIEGLQRDARKIPDVSDRASEEADRTLELRTRDRQRKLITKIEAALRRIETGEYGYCEKTGEPISIKRLDARPTATMSLEAQKKHERSERVHREK